MIIPVKMLNKYCWPYRKYTLDAGFDLRANTDVPIEVPPLGRVKVGTGVCVEIPPGHYGDIRGRSSMNAAGIICPGGTVDAGYTGELHVVLINFSADTYTIKPYERIAQLVIMQIPQISLVEVDELLSEENERGNNGFGSTGRV